MGSITETRSSLASAPPFSSGAPLRSLPSTSRTRDTMPHPAKTRDPAPRKVLHSSVAGGPNKAVTKKGGGGGKGTWGLQGEEFKGAPIRVMDKNDPNYDPDEEACVLEASE